MGTSIAAFGEVAHTKRPSVLKFGNGLERKFSDARHGARWQAAYRPSRQRSGATCRCPSPPALPIPKPAAFAATSCNRRSPKETLMLQPNDGWDLAHTLSERILAANSATFELERWCMERGIGD